MLRPLLVLALAGVCAAPPSARAQNAQPQQREIVLVIDAPGKLVDDAKAALVADGARVSVVLARAAPNFSASANAGAAPSPIFLAAGPESARSLAALAAARVVGPRAAFLLKAADVPAGLSAVALEAPLSSQLKWLALAFPGRTRVIVPRSAAAGVGALDDALRAAAKESGLTVQLVDVRAPGEAVPAIDAALKRDRAPAIILLVPDAVAVTPDTVAPIAQIALAARSPVVGFSTYFLKVGALAGVAVDAAAMARQALALALAGGGASSVPRVEPPAGARLVVDGRLAERLGVTVRSGAGVEVRR